MGRPLKSAYTKDITVHCYEEDGQLIESKLVKQIGFNRYLTTNGVAIRLADKDACEAYKLAGTGYVTITEKDGNKEHSLLKLTKNLITCTDGVIFPFVFDVTITDGVVSSIAQNADTLVSIEGLVPAEDAEGKQDENHNDNPVEDGSETNNTADDTEPEVTPTQTKSRAKIKKVSK